MDKSFIKEFEITKSIKLIKKSLTEKRSSQQFAIVFLIVGLSLFDACATVFQLSFDHMMELNPIMDYYLRQGVGAFIAVKLSLTLFGLIICIFLEEKRNLKRVLILILILYIILTIGHMFYMNFVIFK